MLQETDTAIELATREVPLFAAVVSMNIGKLSSLIAQGVDVNIHAPGGGKTPLHIAVENNVEMFVSLLLQAGADPNGVTKNDLTPLHLAAQLGNLAIINKLLDFGAAINAVSSGGSTPLHEAAARGYVEVCLTLLRRGADSSIRERRAGVTAEKLAIRCGYPHIAAVLRSYAQEKHKQQQVQALSLLEGKLQDKTLAYFGGRVPGKWRLYPETKLIGRYLGHRLLFFTMPQDTATQAAAFTQKLVQDGYAAELRKTQSKPSIVVDLTASL